MVRDYLRLTVFAVGLLVGVQVPGFIDQYQKRVDAHLQEASKNISGFQSTANRFFGGSMETLISHYEASRDPVFEKDAASVRLIYQRFQMLKAEARIFSNPWYRVSLHVASKYRTPIFQETLSSFSHTVPLTGAAILWGVCFAFILTISAESLLIVLGRLGGRMKGNVRKASQ